MGPLPLAPGTTARPARRIFVAAGLMLVAIYAFEARGSFKQLLLPSTVTAPIDRGPFVKGSDLIGYYQPV
jgi:hypothetical protein